ncbi:MAG: BMP family ABC transporter substrate-binding protein, partial [Geminicoccaceae bacterium]|nr:BMP family ABC transporter substrate-binding protein [Geminicoccaceae bacterium]
MGSNWTRRALLVAAAAVGMASASLSPASAEPIRVAAIYTVPVEQQWVSRIHKALNAAAERGDIAYTYSENVKNTDYERVMREYAEAGNQLI